MALRKSKVHLERNGRHHLLWASMVELVTAWMDWESTTFPTGSKCIVGGSGGSNLMITDTLILPEVGFRKMVICSRIEFSSIKQTLERLVNGGSGGP